MVTWLNAIFPTTRYEDETDLARARIAYGILLIYVIGYTIGLVLVPTQFVNQGETEPLTSLERALRPSEYPLNTVVTSFFYTFSIVTYWVVRRGLIRRFSLLPSLLVFFAFVPFMFVRNPGLTPVGVSIFLPMILAGILSGMGGLLAISLLNIVVLGIAYFRFDEIYNIPPAYILTVLQYLAVVGAFVLFIQNVRSSQSQITVLESKRRLQLAQLTVETAKLGAEISDKTVFLKQSVIRLLGAFPQAYHVQIFLAQDRRNLMELVASTGEVGEILLERKHNLPVGSVSAVGQASQRNETITVEVGQTGGVFRPNDLLPDTRFEVSIPLSIGSQVLGVLDLQSKQVNSFPEAELRTLEAIASTLAAVIDNARLLQITQDRLVQSERLTERFRSAQAEVERLNRELTGEAWRDYGNQFLSTLNLDVDLVNQQRQPSQEITPSMQEAMSSKEVSGHLGSEGQIVAIPLRVRGEVIGAMEFVMAENDKFSQDEIELFRELGDRFGIAAESSRLFEQGQRIARREAMVNQFGSHVQMANTIESTMLEAVRHLKPALNAKRIAIRLGKPSQVQTD